MIKVHLSLFVNAGTFPERITVTGKFSKFKKSHGLRMLTKDIFSKGHNRLDWNSLLLSPLKLNLGIFRSK